MLALVPVSVHAAVFDPVYADVTTRSFAGAWMSSEPVSSATLRVYADPAGAVELTGGVNVTLESTGMMLLRGLVLARVTGLASSTCYYVQSETTGSGTVVEPPAPPFTEVCTASRTAKSGPSGVPFANDVLVHAMTEPDVATPATGTFAVLSAPSSAAAPITGVAGSGLLPGEALFDLSNLFSSTDGSSLEVPPGEVIEIREYRGTPCADPTEQSLLRFRRVPVHEELPAVGSAITELESPALCDAADTVCDDQIDIRDVQRILNRFGASSGDCAFNPDLDVVQDGTLDLQDAQDVLGQLGASGPFP